MKKYSFWVNTFLLTFLLGISGVSCWLINSNYHIEDIKPPFLAEPNSFPGLAQKISEIEKDESGYFPKNIFYQKSQGTYGVSLNFWFQYEKYLNGMGEKSLLDISNRDKEVYGFLWLRSFHHPIFVRIERSGNQMKLFTKELDGRGGMEPGNLLREYERSLNEAEWNKFLGLLQEIDYWKLPTEDDSYLANDGAQWVLEAVKNDFYHVVDRQSPSELGYGESCIYLLKLSGVDVDKLGDDLY